MIEWGAIDVVFEQHAEKTTRTSGVVEEFDFIARADERSRARQGEHLLFVEPAHREVLELDEVFQLGQLLWRIAVELIEIDEPHARKQRFSLLVGSELVGVVAQERFGHEQSAKTTLVPALHLADQKGNELITTAGGVPHPKGSKCAQPHAEPLYPQRMVAHSLRQKSSAVLVVPRRKLRHVVVQGVKTLHLVRVEQSIDIAPPHAEFCLDGVNSHRVECALVERTPRGSSISFEPIFRFFRHHIVAQGIARLQQLECLLQLRHIRTMFASGCCGGGGGCG